MAMKEEYTVEDFAKGVKNPYFEKLNKRIEVIVSNEDYAYFSAIAEINEETPQDLMRRCLRIAAKEMREHDDE